MSYREACLSGKYSSLKDLHPFVTEYIEEVQGALTKDQYIDEYLWRGKPVMMRGALTVIPPFFNRPWNFSLAL